MRTPQKAGSKKSLHPEYTHPKSAEPSHITNPVLLATDDFGVNYLGKNHAKHLKEF